jgi:hypothetical protein
MWRGGFRLGLSVSGPFGCRCLTSLAMAPFPHPAHQTGRAVFPHPAFGQGGTDMLLHTFAHEQSSLGSLKLVQAQLLVQVFIVKALLSITLYLELRAQPLAHPMADMAVDVPVGFAHRSDAKVVGPAL